MAPKPTAPAADAPGQKRKRAPAPAPADAAASSASKPVPLLFKLEEGRATRKKTAEAAAVEAAAVEAAPAAAKANASEPQETSAREAEAVDDMEDFFEQLGHDPALSSDLDSDSALSSAATAVDGGGSDLNVLFGEGSQFANGFQDVGDSEDPSNFFSQVLDDLVQDAAQAPTAAEPTIPTLPAQMMPCPPEAIAAQQRMPIGLALPVAQMQPDGSTIVTMVQPTAGPSGMQYHPFSPTKGWFALHSSGRQMQLLERLHCILESSHMPLVRTPGKTLGNVIRWLPPHLCQANGVPDGIAAFELLDPAVFKAEVFPQGGSSSFRKLAKDWGLVSPPGIDDVAPREPGFERTKAQRKISYKCIYLPAEAEEGAPAMDPHRYFTRRPQHRLIEQVEAYAEIGLKPIDDALPVRLPLSDLVDTSSHWPTADDRKWQTTLGAKPPASRPKKGGGRGVNAGGGLRWSAMNIL